MIGVQYDIKWHLLSQYNIHIYSTHGWRNLCRSTCLDGWYTYSVYW